MKNLVGLFGGAILYVIQASILLCVSDYIGQMAQLVQFMAEHQDR
jgi:hypothetical protein